MTCIAAVVCKDGKMMMGGDSAICIGSGCQLMPGGKVIMRKDFNNAKWLLGVAGPAKLIQIIRYCLELPNLKAPKGKKVHGFIVKEFIPKLKTALSENGCLKKKEGTDEFEGMIMICLNGRIMIIRGDFFVQESTNNFSSMGAGGPEAYGVLHFTEQFPTNLGPRKRLEYALKAAEASTNNVRRPFTYVYL